MYQYDLSISRYFYPLFQREMCGVKVCLHQLTRIIQAYVKCRYRDKRVMPTLRRHEDAVASSQVTRLGMHGLVCTRRPNSLVIKG